MNLINMTNKTKYMNFLRRLNKGNLYLSSHSLKTLLIYYGYGSRQQMQNFSSISLKFSLVGNKPTGTRV